MNLTLYTNLTNHKQLFLRRTYFGENTVLQKNKNTTVVHFEFFLKILQIVAKILLTVLGFNKISLTTVSISVIKWKTLKNNNKITLTKSLRKVMKKRQRNVGWRNISQRNIG